MGFHAIEIMACPGGCVGVAANLVRKNKDVIYKTWKGLEDEKIGSKISSGNL